LTLELFKHEKYD